MAAAAKDNNSPKLELNDHPHQDLDYVPALAAAEEDRGVESSAKHDRRLLRKIDLCLLPLCCVAVGLAFVDRQSLGNSSIFGLIEDNHLVGRQYSWLTTVFYLGYMAFELPANLLLHKFDTGIVLSTLMFLWGSMVLLIAVCKNFAGLAAVRFFLGAFESAITPGLLLIMSQFYTTREQASRVLIWSSMNQTFASFTGIITFLLGRHAQRNPNGLAGWQMINIFLGSISVACALVFFYFVGSLDKIRWLDAEQKEHVRERVRANKTNTHQVRYWSWPQARECVTDPQVWLLSLMMTFLCIPNGALSSYIAQIIRALGFTSLNTVLLQIPLSACSVAAIALSILVDMRWDRMRLIMCTAWPLVTMVGLVVLIALPATPAYKWHKYGMVLLVTLFSVAIFFIYSLIPSNIAGRTKKTLVSSCIFVAYCVGNACGGVVFKPHDAPKFHTGLIVCIVCLGVASGLALALRAYYVSTNAKRDKAVHEAGLDEKDRQRLGTEAGELDVTDLQNQFFRYSY
ncbi:hypothetical protein ACM66B_003526 [Microbotryomycetes sp. NB124-2]